ncbi:Kiwa anti-phage protein KwaB-like domain-containing protein [Paenibacillus tundrae]
MNTLIQELNDDFIETNNGDQTLHKLKYITSYFVNLASDNKVWTVKNIEMSESDQNELINNFYDLSNIFVDEFKTEDRDPEFIYKYDTDGLLPVTKEIQDFFIKGILRQQNSDQVVLSQPTEKIVLYETVSDVRLAQQSSKNEQTVQPQAKIVRSKKSDYTYPLKISNYTGNGYPPNDEVKLIVHKFNYHNSSFLLFCNQIRTSLTKTSLKTIVNNKLVSVEKEKFYKINNDISFLLTQENYYIKTITFFEKLFSFDNYTTFKKTQAMASLADSNVILGFENIQSELNKGYMARSVAKISLTSKEIPEFISKNKKSISKYCNDYKVGVDFNSTDNTFTVTDGSIAPLFITYLFSERVAENILGDLVYYKTFNRLNRT